jgi:hypothetical protein
MDRRQFLATAAASAAFALSPLPADRLRAQATSGAPITRWRVTTSEGLDAVAFTGALSGGELYLKSYAKEAAEFGARLPQAIRTDLAALAKDAESSGFGLLWPNLCTIVSGADASSLNALLIALSDPEARLRPALQASSYWEEKSWRWFSAAAPRLRAIFAAMRDAGFADYRRKLLGPDLDARAAELSHVLSGFDVIPWHEKLTGRHFDPNIEIVLLYFSKPHGVRVQGQRFLQAPDWGVTTTLRIAAHEMLHPPIPMKGRVAENALAVFAKDPLITRVVRDHDPKWGYTTLEGYLNEDLTQALDQMISEELGFGRNPADRWRKSDDGMHVLAAGLYGLLRQDRWHETGGSIEDWIGQATRKGRLKPAVLHPVAARVLERPVARLWPLS